MIDDDMSMVKDRLAAMRLSETCASGAAMLCRRIEISEEDERTSQDVSVDGWIVFDLFVGGQMMATGVRAHVQSSSGSASPDVLEVSWPTDYGGPRLAYESFRDNAAGYYRWLIGPEGTMLRIGDDVKDFTITGINLERRRIYEVTVAGEVAGGW